MGRVDKPEIKDWLILGGLVLAIAIVAFDIIAVRGRNNTLRVEMDALSINTQNQVKMAEKKAAEEIERIKQQIKSFEKRISETKKKAAETEPCHSQCKARPHPAQEPMAQRRTDKDIPWEIPSPITGGRGGTIAIC